MLTRAFEFLQFFIASQTNKAITSEIFLSEKTIEFHLDNVYTKIGVLSWLMASIWALHHGIEAETREIPS